MTNLKPLLDLLKTIDNPDALRATLVAMLISVEEHPFIATAHKMQVYAAVAHCIEDLADSLCSCKEGEFCVQCEPRLRTTEGERE